MSASTVKCTRRSCGTTLTERHGRHLGRIALVCEPCLRNKMGLCRDCPAKLDDLRKMRCPSCRVKRRRQVWREVSARQRKDPVRWERIKEARRKRYERNPDAQAKARADNAVWRANNPRKRDDIDRLYHRLKAREFRERHPEIAKEHVAKRRERYRTDPVYRERELARQRERRSHATTETRARYNARRQELRAQRRAGRQGAVA